MKYLEIIIRPERYTATKEALAAGRFYSAITFDVLGRGKKACHYALHDAAESEEEQFSIPFLCKKFIGIYALDEEVEEIISIVKSVNSTGSEGDGKIFVYALEETIRISNGMTGEDALV